MFCSDVHLLPVELLEISSLIVSRGIEKLAWDSSGERLAVSFKDGNEMYRGLVAVYDVRLSPLVSPSLVGFIRGPREGAKPLAFDFHNKFKQGPLLSVFCSHMVRMHAVLEQWLVLYISTDTSFP
nr:unnamed protein product [Digitaria exilis]